MSQKLINEIRGTLSKHVDGRLVDDLLKEFVALKQDVSTLTLGKANLGKFVETLVQILQFLETGKYEQRPSIDGYLRNLESQNTNLPESLKLLVPKVARAIYSIRNRRGIGHKGEVNPNVLDLKFVFNCCQWILAELVRLYHIGDPDDAMRIIESIIVTPALLIEDFGDHKTFLNRKIMPADELLMILSSYYPEYVSTEQIFKDMKRRPKRAVIGSIAALYKKAWAEGSKEKGYKLTSLGYRKAMERTPAAVEKIS